MNDREAYIALNMISAIGPVRVRNLVAALGSPAAVLEATEQDLQKADGIGPELAVSIRAGAAAVDPAAEEGKADRLGARIVTFLDAEYPEPLKTIYDPPLALYVKGTLEKRDKHAMAMVGTRHATHYGLTVADKLSYQLAKTGFTVVSGLARGIDTASHKAALKAGGRTLAVLGSALDKVYPEENAGLAEAISAQGAVISEYALGREPDRTTFPYRNRVVSGLSMGVVVVEADRRSGAIITATQASEQGRHIFAVPGRIDSPASRGTHLLLKQGAKLVEDIDDILQEFELLLPNAPKKADKTLPKRPEVDLSGDEQAVMRALWQGPKDVDCLARETGLKSHQLSVLLLGLEMKRVARILPGRLVSLNEDIKS